MDKKSLLIGYLQRNVLLVFGSDVNGVLTIDFSEEALKDLEVVNRNKMENQIRVFMNNFQLEPSSMIIVLCESVLFQKDIVGIPVNDLDMYVQEFLDTIPFNRVTSKIFTIENGVKVVGINKDLSEVVGSIFTNLGFVVLSTVPEIILDHKIIDETTGVSTDITPFLQNMDFIKTNSMWSSNNQFKTQTQTRNKDARQSSKRLYILLLVFAVLILILIGMILFRR